MLTTLMLVLALVFAVGAVFMVVQAVRGCFFATVWVCCGGPQAACELVAVLIGAVVSGIADATRG